VYNGFYVFDFIAHYWATFSALRALLSSHIMTIKDDDDIGIPLPLSSPLPGRLEYYIADYVSR